MFQTEASTQSRDNRPVPYNLLPTTSNLVLVRAADATIGSAGSFILVRPKAVEDSHQKRAGMD